MKEPSGGNFSNGAETGAFQEIFNSTARSPQNERGTAAMFPTAMEMATEAANGLSMFRFGSEDSAALFFSDLANPITATTGFEVGARLTGC